MITCRIGRFAQMAGVALALLGLAGGLTLHAQWTNRYPKVPGFNHHIYLEGYNLPVISAGVTDPAIAPDSLRVAFASRGWLWVMDLPSRTARRVTRGAPVDARPAWSPDGSRLAFVRDTGTDLSIVELTLASGAERVLVDTPTMDMDPAWTTDGRAVIYSSGEAGDLDLWRLDLTSGQRTQITKIKGIEICPQPLPDGARVLFASKSGYEDSVSIVDTTDGTVRVIRAQGIGSQMRPALAPDGRRFVVPLPDRLEKWHLELLDVAGGATVTLATGRGTPVMPAWSPDGAHVYFVEADAQQQFRLHRIGTSGGPVEAIDPASWEWGEPTARVMVRTREKGRPALVPARLAIIDGQGHPVVAESAQPRFDGQNGQTFIYSTGALEVTVPAGEVKVEAALGLTARATATRRVRAGETNEVDIELERAWDTPAGWYSGDLHFHLNYGGPYLLEPDALVPMMQAEDLDVATPQVANNHTRFTDTAWWGWRRGGSAPPVIVFSQEIRSHFLGHLGAIGNPELFWPWFWGPGYVVYGADDRPNADALRFTRAQGGLAFYVHPVSPREPFPAGAAPQGIPLELVPDAVLGDLDAIELACLWSDEIGTGEVWHRLLSIGANVVPSAGTDAMPNLGRTMAIGTTRVYARVEGPFNFGSYLDAVKRGRTFVTNGPFVRFTMGGIEPGGVVTARTGALVSYSIAVTSVVPFETVEILVNGDVVKTTQAPAGQLRDSGARGPMTHTAQGSITLPSGGWVTLRVRGGRAGWPVMDSYPFAETAPVWIGAVGSRDPAAARRAAQELLRWMDVADQRLATGYGTAPIPRLTARFTEARRRLEAIAAGQP